LGKQNNKTSRQTNKQTTEPQECIANGRARTHAHIRTNAKHAAKTIFGAMQAVVQCRDAKGTRGNDGKALQYQHLKGALTVRWTLEKGVVGTPTVFGQLRDVVWREDTNSVRPIEGCCLERVFF
jgi:hypothetical protein